MNTDVSDKDMYGLIKYQPYQNREYKDLQELILSRQFKEIKKKQITTIFNRNKFVDSNGQTIVESLIVIYEGHLKNSKLLINIDRKVLNHDIQLGCLWSRYPWYFWSLQQNRLLLYILSLYQHRAELSLHQTKRKGKGKRILW